MPTALVRAVILAILTCPLGGCVVDGRNRPYHRTSSQERPRTITCESDDGRGRSCRTDMRIARAELEKRFSKSPCDLGRTWGYDDNEIWVDQGCRGRFRVYPRGYGDDGSIIRCESQDDRRRSCDVGFRIDRADVDRRLSDSRCDYGDSWGIDGRRIWVDRGCRADFRVYRR